VVQSEVLDKIGSDKLRAFVIWTPRYPGDNRAKALSAMKLVGDQRALHFWDPSGWLGKYYGKTLKLPGERKFAWDVYFAFDAHATWDQSPPAPAQWMHQLGERDPRTLNGDKLRDMAASLLKDAK
jgi:hypothetical protein